MATYAVKVDMNTSRTEYLADDTDVSADVTAVGGVGDLLLSTERGHDLSRVLAPPMSGAMHATLDNQSGDYDIGTDLKAGRHGRVTATHSATDYEMFNGIVDHPVQAPYDDGINRYVYLTVLGNLSRLVGRAVDTALYSDISTGTAIGHLLDAAGVAKNLPDYLDDLTPVGGWNLASTSGDDPDTSGNGNDAVLIAIGTGTRGAAAIEDGGTLSTDFDGADTRFDPGSAAVLDNILATGGLILCCFVADSDGETDLGTLVTKTTWKLGVSDQSGSTMRLRFHHTYSGADGVWTTTSRLITVGTNYMAAVYFDRTGGTAENPTIWLFDIDAMTFSTLTVGSGLTEDTTPTGTVDTDAANSVYIGGESGGTYCFDGKISVVRLYDATNGDEAAWTILLKEAAARAANAPRHLDDGGTDLSWWWLDNEDAFTAIEVLKNTEGPGAALYEDPTGAIVFKDRYARATETRSTVVQTTFNDRPGDTEPLLSLPFAYDPGLKDVVNVCAVEVRRREAQTLAVVWELGEDANLGANESRTYIARQSSGDPFTAAVTPTTGGGDYTVASGSVASLTLDRTSGAQVKITITAGASGAGVTGLRLRAQSVDVVNTAVRQNTIDTSTSQEAYGRRDFRLRIRPEIDFNLAQDFCDAIVTYYQDGRPQITITVDAEQANERMVAALTREVGDRIHVTVAPDVDSDMVVEHIRHDIFAPATQRTTLGCEIAGTVADYFVLDTSEMDSADEIGF